MLPDENVSLRAYRTSGAACVPLDREPERQLTYLWRAGDRAAGAKIVTACLPFVMSIALEYRRWGIPVEDIVQQGNLGLLRAAAKFHPDRECRLATYAAYWIRAEIREYVVRAYRIVRLGTTKGERRALRAYRTTRETDPEKLAALSGLSIERTMQLMPLPPPRKSSPDAAGGDVAPGVERLASPDPSPEANSSACEARAQAKAAVSRALRQLSERERMIVRERMMAEDPTTLEQL